MIAGVLVRKNPKKPAGAKQLDWLVKSFASVEKLRAGAGPSSADIPVDVTVAQSLVRRSNPRIRRAAVLVVADLGAMEIEIPEGDVPALDRKLDCGGQFPVQTAAEPHFLIANRCMI